MPLSNEHIGPLFDQFKGCINLLVVDDYPDMGTILTDLFSSPLFKPTLATSAARAREIISKTDPWHCWILDIALEEEDSGLQILSENPHFPFVVMLSGIKSMNVASHAMQLGAFKVYDKEPDLLPRLHQDVCSLAAISYILRGAGTKYLSLFMHLVQSEIDSTETWANKACLTVRQLERICSMHSHLTPRFIPSLFYTLRLLLLAERDMTLPSATRTNRQVQQHVDFVLKHLDTIIKN
jgi:CheY-like chemotaxis protein